MHSAGIGVVLWAVWARGKEPHHGPVTPVVVFFIAVCNSIWFISSYGWHSVSAYFGSSLLIHSAEWLYSLFFSKMERQNVSVSSFSGFSSDIFSLPRFLKNFLSIVCKRLVLTELFTSFYISPDSFGFCLNFIFRDSLTVCTSWFVVICISF